MANQRWNPGRWQLRMCQEARALYPTTLDARKADASRRTFRSLMLSGWQGEIGAAVEISLGLANTFQIAFCLRISWVQAALCITSRQTVRISRRVGEFLTVRPSLGQNCLNAHLCQGLIWRYGPTPSASWVRSTIGH